jgi:hypothetical protein
MMRDGRRRDSRGLDFLGELLRRPEGFDAMALRDFFGHAGVEIVEAHEVDARHLRVDARMFAPDMAHADHADT